MGQSQQPPCGGAKGPRSAGRCTRCDQGSAGLAGRSDLHQRRERGFGPGPVALCPAGCGCQCCGARGGAAPRTGGGAAAGRCARTGRSGGLRAVRPGRGPAGQQRNRRDPAAGFHCRSREVGWRPIAGRCGAGRRQAGASSSGPDRAVGAQVRRTDWCGRAAGARLGLAAPDRRAGTRLSRRDGEPARRHGHGGCASGRARMAGSGGAAACATGKRDRRRWRGGRCR